MQSLKNRVLGCCTVLLALALGSAAVEAADEPANIIKYRQSIMKAIGGHMGAVAGVAKGEVTFTDEVAGHAHAINEMGKNLLRLFPKDSGPEAGETRALPVIWEKWSDFEAAVDSLKSESAKLAEVAKGGDTAAIAEQVGALGKNGCGGCHKTFRKKKEE
jgi:cytochrome c556